MYFGYATHPQNYLQPLEVGTLLYRVPHSQNTPEEASSRETANLQIHNSTHTFFCVGIYKTSYTVKASLLLNRSPQTSFNEKTYSRGRNNTDCSGIGSFFFTQSNPRCSASHIPRPTNRNYEPEQPPYPSTPCCTKWSN